MASLGRLVKSIRTNQNVVSIKSIYQEHTSVNRRIIKEFIAIVIMMGSICFSCTTFGEPAKENVEKNIITLNPESIKIAGIEVIKLEPQVLPYLITAPGEVIPNSNLTTKITTRVSAQVVHRYVQEGQHIKAGQPLVELSSVDMAKTQGDLLLAAQDWQRVKSLGKDAISAKRYSEAQVTYQRAYSTAMAYGMTENEVNELLITQKPSQAKGTFKLLSPRDGTIFNVNVTEGEVVEPGKILLQIVEEANVWVDAMLPPDLVRPVNINDSARLLLKNRSIVGRVIQIHHQLDETTRTRSVRLEFPNTDDALHPGQYVNCQIQSGQTPPLLAVPVDAVLRTTDGDSAIYVEKQPGKFQQIEVKIKEVIDSHAVIEGIAPGTRVVIKGAFFVHAELNKSGFDAH